MQIRTSTGILAVASTALLAFMIVLIAFYEPPFLSWFRPSPPLPSPEATVETEMSSSSISVEHPRSLPSILADNGALYRNKKFGFSLVVPKSMIAFDGRCLNAEQSDTGGTKIVAWEVPVEVIEASNSFLIKNAYGFNIEEGKCKRYTTREVLEEENEDTEQGAPGYWWNIQIRTVTSERELDAWMKERYGEGCSIGALKPSFQTGVFDVEIKGDGKDLGETACPVNYATFMKYVPEKHRAYSWDVGQEAVFWTDEEAQSSYDAQMISSFRVEM